MDGIEREEDTTHLHLQRTYPSSHSIHYTYSLVTVNSLSILHNYYGMVYLFVVRSFVSVFANNSTNKWGEIFYCKHNIHKERKERKKKRSIYILQVKRMKFGVHNWEFKHKNGNQAAPAPATKVHCYI